MKNKSVTNHLAVTTGVVFSILLGWTPMTFAQAGEQDSSSSVLEEVIVTSRRREESLQDIPDTITSFSATQIEAAGIDHIQDVVNLTSNFVLLDDQNTGTFTMTVRGISQNRNGDAPVAFVLDGVTLPSPNSFMQDLFDVERIEVLKGPQGALYGRNSIGGAVNIITKEASNEFSGQVKLGYGQGSDYRAAGSISGPIIQDKAFFRFSASVRDGDGIIENTYVGEKVDPIEDINLRGKLKFMLSDNVTLDLRGYYNDMTAGAAYYAPVDGNGFAGDPCCTPRSDEIGFTDREMWDISAKLDWESEQGTLTVISAYTDIFETFREDLDFTSIAALEATQPLSVESLTHEIRFTSPNDQRLRWLVGGFYQDTSRDIDTLLDLNLNGPFAVLAGLPPGAGVPEEKFLITLPLAVQQQDNEAYAFFGQISYDISDDLELTTALRYDHEKRQEFSPAPNPGIPPQRSEVFDLLQPKVSLAYSINDGLMTFATFSRGFRPGGFNGNTSFGAQFEAEESSNYEIGFKSTLAGGRAYFNGAVFFVDYTNQQFYVLDVVTGGQAIFNAQKTEISGFELDLTSRPMENFDLGFGFGYVDTKLKEFGSLPAGSSIPITDPTDLDGNELINTPEYTINVSAQYTMPVSDALNVVARADYEHRGKIYWHLDNVHKQSAYGLLNLRLTLESDDWSLTGYIENALDKDYHVTYFNAAWTGLFTGTDVFFPSFGSRWGIEARYRF